MNVPSETLVADPVALRASVGLPQPARSTPKPPAPRRSPKGRDRSSALLAVAWAVGGVALVLLAIAVFLWARR